MADDVQAVGILVGNDRDLRLANVFLGADASEVSLLYWAYYVSECEGVAQLMGTRDGAQWAWWVGGAAQVSWRIADAIGREKVLLNWPVTRIAQDDDGITVFSGERSLRARNVIIAMAPIAANQIRGGAGDGGGGGTGCGACGRSGCCTGTGSRRGGSGRPDRGGRARHR